MIGTMTLSQLSRLTGGTLRGADAGFTAVSTDTRTLAPGELFVALTGPNFDGNTFVASAQERGAVAALVGTAVQTALPVVQVADTRIALGQLAQANRRRSQAVVLGLTGSQGKTTVKEMTAAILAHSGPVLATRGNLNNDIGVPLTLLRIAPEHRFAVIEMGANAAGEIAYTTRLAEPDIALINNVEPTHLEGFGSIEGVAEAKAELWQGLNGTGRAIVNLDNPYIPPRVNVQHRQQVVGISAEGKPNADYAVERHEDLGLQGSRFSLRTPSGTFEVQLALPGRHNVANALAAAAMAMEAGATPEQVGAGLAAMASVKGRLVVRRGKAGAVVLDDTYNASPASFKAAIDVLKRQPGIRIVVAGDMGELGIERHKAHQELGGYAREQGIDHFLGTGELTQLAVRGFGANGVHAPDWQALAQAVLPLLAPDVTVLVKGSRSAGMERVLARLIEEEN